MSFRQILGVKLMCAVGNGNCKSTESYRWKVFILDHPTARRGPTSYGVYQWAPRVKSACQISILSNFSPSTHAGSELKPGALSFDTLGFNYVHTRQPIRPAHPPRDKLRRMTPIQSLAATGDALKNLLCWNQDHKV